VLTQERPSGMPVKDLGDGIQFNGAWRDHK
jgi:hypothetical protein